MNAANSAAALSALDAATGQSDLEKLHDCRSRGARAEKFRGRAALGTVRRWHLVLADGGRGTPHGLRDDRRQLFRSAHGHVRCFPGVRSGNRVPGMVRPDVAPGRIQYRLRSSRRQAGELSGVEGAGFRFRVLADSGRFGRRASCAGGRGEIRRGLRCRSGRARESFVAAARGARRDARRRAVGLGGGREQCLRGGFRCAAAGCG